MSKRVCNNDQTGVVLERHFGTLECVDAKKDIRVFVTPQDFKGAVRKDETNCVLARACKRAFGCTKVMVLRRCAYLDLPREDGTRRLERFMLSSGAARYLAGFDQGERLVPAAGFVFRAPARSETFEVERMRTREGHARRKRGEYLKPKRRKPAPDPTMGSVRNGRGAVHFTIVMKPKKTKAH